MLIPEYAKTPQCGAKGKSFMQLATEVLAQSKGITGAHCSAAPGFVAEAIEFLEAVVDGTIKDTPVTAGQLLVHAARVAIVYGLEGEYEVIGMIESGDGPKGGVFTYSNDGTCNHIFAQGLAGKFPFTKLFGGKAWWNEYIASDLMDKDGEAVSPALVEFHAQYFGGVILYWNMLETHIKANKALLTASEALELLTDMYSEVALATFDTIAFYIFREGHVKNPRDVSNNLDQVVLAVTDRFTQFLGFCPQMAANFVGTIKRWKS